MQPALLVLLGAGGSAAASHTVSVPGSVTKTASTSQITTASVLATVTGGVGPFTYQWVLSNQVGTLFVTANSPISSSTTFKITSSFSGDNGVCDAVCQVTDTGNGNAIATSNICSVTIYNP